MPWDLTIRSVKGSIGSLESVHATISQVLPAIRFGSEPSGAEKVRVAEAQGIKFPSILREAMIAQPAKHVAEFEAGDISLSFRFGSEALVREIGLEVRGAGDPFPFVRKFASVADWEIIDDSNGTTLSVDTQCVGTGREIYQRMRAAARSQK